MQRTRIVVVLIIVFAFLAGFAAGQRKIPTENAGQSEEQLRSLDLSNELDSANAGPKAKVRPYAPFNTITSTSSEGTRSRPTGQVSAQGQGLTCMCPASVLAQARRRSTCASLAFAWIHDPSPICHSPMARKHTISMTSGREVV